MSTIRTASGLALAALLSMLLGTQAAGADQGTVITLNESGFTPPAVTISSGGTVTFKNTGNSAHAVATIGGAPATFNTGGIGSGQSASLTLTTPGPYYYTSATDCLFNASTPGFPCSASFLIQVLPVGASAPPAPQPTAVAPTATPAPVTTGGPPGSATVTLTDSGISPAAVTIALNGGVTFVNKGANVHTATSTADSNAQLPSFDTGGITAGQSFAIGFTTPGTYVYTSETDCLNGNVSQGFACGNTYTITVSSSPAQQVPQAAGPTPTPVNVPGSNTSVTINDANGFAPNQVTIKVGQSVGWLNVGNQTHAVVMNQPPIAGQPAPWWLPYAVPSVGGVSFDSGGIDPNKTFVYTFTIPGTFPYHSSTEPIYQQNNQNCSCTLLTWQFFGSVVVTP